MKRLALLLLLCCLVGCETVPTVADRATSAPLNAQCAPQCAVICTPETWPLWEGDAYDPATWDELGALIDSLKAIGERCENARLACAQCLRRLEGVQAICGFQQSCGEVRDEPAR